MLCCCCWLVVLSVHCGATRVHGRSRPSGRRDSAARSAELVRAQPCPALPCVPFLPPALKDTHAPCSTKPCTAARLHEPHAAVRVGRNGISAMRSRCPRPVSASHCPAGRCAIRSSVHALSTRTAATAFHTPRIRSTSRHTAAPSSADTQLQQSGTRLSDRSTQQSGTQAESGTAREWNCPRERVLRPTALHNLAGDGQQRLRRCVQARAHRLASQATAQASNGQCPRAPQVATRPQVPRHQRCDRLS